MFGRFFFVALFGLLLVAVVIGIGASAYHMGVIQGAAQGASTDAVDAAPGVVFYRHPFFPGHFGGFGLLVPLFFLLLFFGGLRAMGWGRWGRWGHGHWHRGHPHHPGWENDVPPMFAEWHRRAHEAKPDAPGDAKPV